MTIDSQIRERNTIAPNTVNVIKYPVKYPSSQSFGDFVFTISEDIAIQKYCMPSICSSISALFNVKKS